MAHSQDNLSFVLVYISLFNILDRWFSKKNETWSKRDKSLPRIFARKNENDRIWMVVIAIVIKSFYTKYNDDTLSQI